MAYIISLYIFIKTKFLSFNKKGKREYPNPIFKDSKVAKIIYFIFILFISILYCSKDFIHITSSKSIGLSPEEKNCWVTLCPRNSVKLLIASIISLEQLLHIKILYSGLSVLFWA